MMESFIIPAILAGLTIITAPVCAIIQFIKLARSGERFFA